MGADRRAETWEWGCLGDREHFNQAGRTKVRRTSRPLRPINVEYHVDRLLYLKNTLFSRRAYGPDIDGHGLPRRIEQLVPVQQTCDSSLSLAWEELQEGGQVLGANHLVRQHTVQQMHVCSG
jgi:hypothetical protein